MESDITKENLEAAGYQFHKDDFSQYYFKNLSTCLQLQIGYHPFNYTTIMLFIGGHEDVEPVYIGINLYRMSTLKTVERLFKDAPMDFANVAFIDLQEKE